MWYSKNDRFEKSEFFDYFLDKSLCCLMYMNTKYSRNLARWKYQIETGLSCPVWMVKIRIRRLIATYEHTSLISC